MSWEFRNGIPIYQQIVQMMEIRIANGTYAPGERLPAVRDLALEAGVNPNTMQRAMAELDRSGLVRSERTNGRFVSEDDDQLSLLRERLADGYIRDMAENLQALGIEPEGIPDIVHKWFQNRVE